MNERDRRPIPNPLENPQNGRVYATSGVLGAGGMATVFEARFDAPLAIKRVVPDVIWSYWAERDLLASLDHPNIIRLVDSFEIAEGSFLIFERADSTGEDLGSRIGAALDTDPAQRPPPLEASPRDRP